VAPGILETAFPEAKATEHFPPLRSELRTGVGSHHVALGAWSFGDGSAKTALPLSPELRTGVGSHHVAPGILETAFPEAKATEHFPPLRSELRTGVGSHHIAPRVQEGDVEELEITTHPCHSPR
jgi:hypothetical protein